MEACVRCHRRARQLVPTDWPPRRRFALWQPSGMSMAYAHLGLSQEVFDELDALKAQSEDEWSVEERFQYYGICSNQYRETGRWDEVEEHSRVYVDWAKALPAADPRLQIRPLALTEEGDENAGAHNGDDFRWWTVCYALADRILRARHETGRATADILAELDWALNQHQSAGSYSIAGQSACETGHYSEALRYLRHEEELEGRLAGRGDIYLGRPHSSRWGGWRRGRSGCATSTADSWPTVSAGVGSASYPPLTRSARTRTWSNWSMNGNGPSA